MGGRDPHNIDSSTVLFLGLKLLKGIPVIHHILVSIAIHGFARPEASDSDLFEITQGEYYRDKLE